MSTTILPMEKGHYLQENAGTQWDKFDMGQKNISSTALVLCCVMLASSLVNDSKQCGMALLYACNNPNVVMTYQLNMPVLSDLLQLAVLLYSRIYYAQN